MRWHSRDGRLLATGGNDRIIKLWDVATGTQQFVLRGHDSRIWRMEFSPDGHRLASGSTALSVRLWDVESGQEVLALKTGMNAAFGPDGHQLFVAGMDGMLRIYDSRPLEGD